MFQEGQFHWLEQVNWVRDAGLDVKDIFKIDGEDTILWTPSLHAIFSVALSYDEIRNMDPMKG